VKRTPLNITSQQETTTVVSPQHLLNAFPEACCLLSSEGVMLEVNKRLCSFLESSEGKLSRKSINEIIFSESRTFVQQQVQECLKNGTIQEFETQFLLKNNSQRTAGCYLSPGFFSENGERVVLLVIRDVAEKKQRELDLLRFTNVAHYTVNPLEITDVKGHIVYVNPAFEKASGYSKEEIIGQNPNLFGSGKHSKLFWRKMWETISAGKVWMGEVENRRKNGDAYYTQLLISPILDSGGHIVGYFGIHRDITEQKQLKEQLIQAQKMESIGLLAAGVAHEVGNPLTSISSIVQVLQRTTDDEFTHEKLELIKSQVGRISRTIRNLVDFSRRSSYEVQMTDVVKLLRESVEIVRVGKKAKQILFSVDLDASIPLLRLVPDQIEQVFINILINAVDAIYDNPFAIHQAESSPSRGEISVNAYKDKEHLSISIHDSGKGIREVDLPKIFEPFYTTKKVGEGTGLGLWVSYGIIKSFHGEIKVESAEGEGTTFTVLLPLHSEM